MEKQLLVIPCCSRKLKGGVPKHQSETFFESTEYVTNLITAREKIKRNHQVIDQKSYMPAWDRYDGGLYRVIKEEQALINRLFEHGVIDILIVSAFYGVINHKMEINNYDLMMSQAGIATTWGCAVSEAISVYAHKNGIAHIHLFLAQNYLRVATACKNLTNSTDHWVYGLRGVNKINSHVGRKFIELLKSLENKYKNDR